MLCLWFQEALIISLALPAFVAFAVVTLPETPAQTPLELPDHSDLEALPHQRLEQAEQEVELVVVPQLEPEEHPQDVAAKPDYRSFDPVLVQVD